MTINLKELQADREAGTKGPWEVGYAESVWAPAPSFDSNGPFCQLATVRQTAFGDGVLLVLSPEREANLRRIARLPDVEAALIEAVGVMAILTEIVGDQLDGDFPEPLECARTLLAKLGAEA